MRTTEMGDKCDPKVVAEFVLAMADNEWGMKGSKVRRCFHRTAVCELLFGIGRR